MVRQFNAQAAGLAAGVEQLRPGNTAERVALTLDATFRQHGFASGHWADHGIGLATYARATSQPPRRATSMAMRAPRKVNRHAPRVRRTRSSKTVNEAVVTADKLRAFFEFLTSWPVRRGKPEPRAKVQHGPEPSGATVKAKSEAGHVAAMRDCLIAAMARQDNRS